MIIKFIPLFFLLLPFLYNLFFIIDINMLHFSTVLLNYHQGYHNLLFFFCYSLLWNIRFFFLGVITHFFLSFFAISFDYSFSSSTKLLCMNFSLFLSFSPELRFMNFDFLFTGNFTLFELVFSFSRSIANFTFCFSSSLRTNCRTIASAVSEISSKVEKTPAVPFNDFCGATRKLLLLEQ